MKLRLPLGMRDRIAENAKRNGRSMNAEIVRLIERSLASDAEAAEEVVGAADQVSNDMEAAALKFYQALQLARTHGGRVSLQVNVEGIENDELRDALGLNAFDALRSGRPATVDDRSEDAK